MKHLAEREKGAPLHPPRMALVGRGSCRNGSLDMQASIVHEFTKQSMEPSKSQLSKCALT